MPKTIHEFVARGIQQSHQFAIVFKAENGRWDIILVFFGRFGKTRDMLICRRSQQRPDHCSVDSVVNGILCMN